MTETSLLLRLLDQAFDHRCWHGTNLKGAIRGVDPEEAVWRPGTERPNVQELVVHCAYWKYSVERRLRELPRGSFPLEGSDWYPRAEPSATRWKADRDLLLDRHRRLREAVAALAPERLDETPAGSKTPIRDLVLGVAAHDLHHGGQIQLLRRLRRAVAAPG